MTSIHVDASKPVLTQEQEIGLRLPNGTTIFPPEKWHDHPLETAAQRDVILSLIRGSAIRLGYDEDHFLPDYGWASREVIRTAVYMDGDGDDLPITSTGHITVVATDSIPPGGVGLAFDPEQFKSDIGPVTEEALLNGSSAR